MGSGRTGPQARYADQLLEAGLEGGGARLPDPYVHDMSAAALRQDAVNLIAKRHADMLFVSGFARAEIERLYVPDVSAVTHGGFAATSERDDFAEAFAEAWRSGAIGIEVDSAARSVAATWRHGDATGHAQAVDGCGVVVLGPRTRPGFAPPALKRPAPRPDIARPLGDKVDVAGSALAEKLAGPVGRLFEAASGLFGVVVASPERILFERYAGFFRAEQPVPTWSMTKAVTATLVARLIREGWLEGVNAPARPPLWGNPRGIHALITVDQLLRMRAGLAFPTTDGAGGGGLIFESAFAYHVPGDLFELSQRAVVAAIPGATFRYANTGINVLGAIVRQAIEARGLPYHATVYSLLADRIGMASYQHSADSAGNFVASGSGFATLRDLARLGVLYLRDGVWDGERLLPEGWVDYALTPSHAASPYAACFRTNAHRALCGVPADVAWACGGATQKVLLLRRQGLTMVLCSQHGHPVDDALVAGVVRALL